MNYGVVLTAEARRNLADIRDWIAVRSPEGAAHWVEAFEAAVARLELDPFLSPVAPENGHALHPLRNIFFQTRRGRRYRAVFYVQNRDVIITHVRGPKQRLIPPDEFVSSD
jgi:plasmid stabilization system protein ParE